MADANAYDMTIVLPVDDVRAVVAYATGQDPGPPTPEAYRLAGEEVRKTAEAAIVALLRRCADFRPISASVTIRREEVDPNAPIPLTRTGDPT
ncbi:hypothetical protein ACFXDE_15995 [Kitasatospora sp. NPDC059408]|uniref:hypothetical protein n=1 Tax=Kitasatospora sp. NPDC059408 TaxID=3346823 RepID=UPI0036CBB94D